MVRADHRLEQGFPSFTLPLLILHGSADKATQPSGSQLFFERATATDKAIKIYDGHYHDLLNDLDKQQVMNDILAWLETRLSQASSI
jgi:alpha-beta hydrolase superfamily lysophospholipase